MAANDAELLLKVGLDLGHFRGQLNRLSSELAGQPINLNVKFNRSGIASELNLLQRQLGNKTFRVEVASNLKAEIENADKLVKALGRVQAAATGAKGSLPIGTSQLGRTAGQGGFTAAQIKTLFSAAVKGGLLDERALGQTRAQMVAALGSIGRDSIEGLLNGLNSGDAKLQAAARSLGDSLISALKDALGIASPSKETGKLGKFAAEGFEKGFVSGMVKAERQMAQAIRFAVVSAIREGLSNLPGLGNALVGFERQLAASVQLAVRKAMRDGMAASIAPGAKGGLLGGTGGAATGAAIGGAKALGGGIAGGVAKLTAGGLMGTAANLARYSMDSSAYQEFVGKLYQEIINSALSSGTQGAIIGALAVGGVAGGVGFARGATGSLAIQAITAIRNRILAALLAVSTGNLNNIVEVMVRDVTGAIFQKTIRQLRAANAQLPSINWPAAIPSRTMEIGPSSSGRLLASAQQRNAIAAAPSPAGLLPSVTRQSGLTSGLEALMRALSAQPRGTAEPAGAIVTSDFLATMRERFARAAERYLFGVETQVVDLYDAAIRQVEVAVDRHIAKIQGQISQKGRQTVSVVDLGTVAQRLIPGVAPAKSPLMLPPAGGTTPVGQMRFNAVSTGATVGNQTFMRAPAIPTPLSGVGSGAGGGGGTGGGGGGRRGGGGGGGGMFGGLPNINLPGSRDIRELGQEFGFATKQVLLFGQAYKLLAFVQAFPGQIGQAVGELQSFRNTLNAISPSAEEFKASNEFILNTVDKYNVPLQSARDGFTKLYASMAPAGFGGNEIRDLFLGISKAAATFGMSADKVDRVTYAFAQMASKGQVMSEELKGQLGDVLPGALGIFAEAAGYKGSGAIEKFSKALEDGAFKGGAMRKLLKNVTIELNKEFGPGAEGAAKTYQGVMIRMANSTKLFYESFEPVAIKFLNAVVMPITSGIKTITDGFNAFFTGTAAKTAGGAAFAQQLTQLKPAFEGIGTNVKQLIPVLQSFGNILAGVAKAAIQIAGNPIVGYLAKVYAIALPLTMVFNGVRTAIFSVITAMTSLNVGLLAGAQRFTTYRLLMAETGRSAAQLSVTLRAIAPALNFVTVALRAIAMPAILFGISALIERFMMLNAAIDGVKQSAQQMVASISGMANAGAVRDLKNLSRDLGKQRQTFEEMRPYVSGGLINGPAKQLTPAMAKKMQELGMGSFISTDVFGKPYVKDFVNASNIIEARLKGIEKQAAAVKDKLPLAEKISADLAEQVKPAGTAPIDMTGAVGDETGNKKLEDYLSKRSELLQKLGEVERGRIDLIAGLSTEERAILQAQQAFINENQVNDKKYIEDQAKANNYSIATRGKYLADLKESYLAEKKIIAQRRDLAVFAPLLRLEENLINQNEELIASLAALEDGRSELNATDKVALEIGRAQRAAAQIGVELTQEQIEAIRTHAKVQDELNSKIKYGNRIKSLKEEIALLRTITNEEYKRLQIQQENSSLTEAQRNRIYDLEKIKENLAKTRALIDDFVKNTTGDYKGFLKAIIQGEDAIDALEQFQKALADRVLTIFLDLAMAPVEQFMQETLRGIFLPKNIPGLEERKTKEATPVEDNTEATNKNTEALNQLTDAIKAKGAGDGGGGKQQNENALTSFVDTIWAGASVNMAGISYGQAMGDTSANFSGISEQIRSLIPAQEAYMQSIASTENVFQNATFGINEQLQMTNNALASAKEESDKKSADFKESLGKAVAAIGVAAGSIMGIAAGIQQIGKGDTASVLGGIGSILMSLGGGIAGFGRIFGWAGFANGGVASGGFKAFADGGMVTGPTLGLVGEGKYNEAIVPLPDGRSIPVQLQDSSIRDKMGGNGASMAAMPMLSMSFQTTTINGIEYVDRAQLEAAMAETRRISVREGATRGATIALDKLANSPSSRRRIGLR